MKLGCAIGRDGSVLDLKALKETKDGVVFAEIIVHYTKKISWLVCCYIEKGGEIVN